MAEYKKILTGYVNDSKKGDGQYLTITNASDEDIVLKPGEKLYLNKTSQELLSKYPKIPHFSKSIKIEEKVQEPTSEDVADDIPW